MFEQVWRIKDEWARVAGLEHSCVLVLCISANAFGLDWTQLRLPCSQLSTLNHQPPGAPLTKARRFIPLIAEPSAPESLLQVH